MNGNSQHNLGHGKSGPSIGLNASSLLQASPRQSVTRAIRESIGKGAKQLSQSMTYIPKKQKLSIFDGGKQSRPSRPVTHENSFDATPITNITIQNTTNIRSNSTQQIVLFDNRVARFLDHLPAEGRQENDFNVSEFAPDIFQKLRLLEEEVQKLKALNDQKSLEIRSLTLKVGNYNSNPKTAQDKDLAEQNAALREENARVIARVKELEFIAFRQTPHPGPKTGEIDLVAKVVALERENRDLRERYETFKRIANNSTFEDLEKAMRKIQEMEAYIKSLKRKNELLEAQVHSEL